MMLFVAGIDESTGSMGDSYDKVLAETVNGLCKTEVIYAETWDTLAQIEWAPLRLVRWWSVTRIHSNLDYRTPQETEDHYWQTLCADTPKLTSRHLGQNPRRFT